MEEWIMRPIGYVRNAVREKKDVAWGEDVSEIELCEAYAWGLTGLEHFSHAIILF